MTQPKSSCCNAPTRTEGGVGDFHDNDRAVTMHAVCEVCNKPCDYAVEPKIEEKIADILGLENSPEGEPNFFLIRDEDRNVLEGVDFSEEVDNLVAFVEEAKKEERKECIEVFQQKMTSLGVKWGRLHKGDCCCEDCLTNH